jgi:AcrR family transcriptional regulator
VTVEKWTPERRLERTRAALIASARHVFATRGFEGASLDEIADAAGYTRGAIYRHFANKEDLFFAVSDAINTEVLDTFAEELDLEAGSTLDDNQQAAAIWMKALAGNKEIWALSLEFSLYQYRNPAVQERSANQRRQNRTKVAAFMEHYTAAQGITLKVPAETIAAILLIASDGFVQAARIDTDTEDLFATFLDTFIPAVMEDPRVGVGVVRDRRDRLMATPVATPGGRARDRVSDPTP